MTEKMRSDFETEILKRKAAFQVHRVASGEYQNCATQEIWEYWQAATKAEQERCAKVCEARFMGDLNREDLEARNCAAAIRQGGDA